MKTIVLSDMALLGSDVEDTREGIKRLLELQQKGIKTIILSNRPEYCMRKIGAEVSESGEVRYQYLEACANKGAGFNVILYRPGIEILYSVPVRADYTIFGNGICTFDENDDLIRMGEFIKRKDLDYMIEILEDTGYASIDERARSKDKFGDRCFTKGEDVYKFFVPEVGVNRPSNRVYGMQCSGRNEESDAYIISLMEEEMANIKGYRLNGKPCFYQRDVNKLVALEKLFDHEDIKENDTLMILSELTDEIIIEQFPQRCEVVKGELKADSPKTLAKVLKELD